MKKPRLWSPVIIKTCPMCGTEFIRNPVHFQRHCSPKCAKRAKNQSEARAKVRRKGQEKKVARRLRECLRCGQGFMSEGPQCRICPECSKQNHQMERTHADAALVGGYWIL